MPYEFGATVSIATALKVMTNRCSAIEPATGHMKMHARIDCNLH